MGTGSARDRGKLSLQWEMFCWHPTKFSDENKPKERDKRLHGGFERITGTGQSMTLVVRFGESELLREEMRKHEIALGILPEGRISIELTPTDKLASPAPAGPHLDSKGGRFNKFFDILFRPISFEIEVDADGHVIAPEPDHLLPIQDPAPDPVDGVPQRPAPGPHAYVFVETTRARGAIRHQRIQIDWKPDWIARHSPHLGPLPVDRESNDIREIILHVTGGPLIAGAVSKFLRTSAKKTSGIHYIVDMDGHIIKMLHERDGAFHAGHVSGVHLAGWGEGESAARVARTSIGIEHVATAGNEWPDVQIQASLELVRQLTNHFGLSPRDVIGHNDVIVLKSTRALPKKTKVCPGDALPWERYQEAGLSLTAKSDFNPPADIYGGIFNTQAFLDDSAPADVVQELQEDLNRIGWWLPARRGGHRRFGTFDEHTEAGVTRFQARFMARQGFPFTPAAVDLITARIIKQVVANL